MSSSYEGFSQERAEELLRQKIQEKMAESSDFSVIIYEIIPEERIQAIRQEYEGDWETRVVPDPNDNYLLFKRL